MDMALSELRAARRALYARLERLGDAFEKREEQQEELEELEEFEEAVEFHDAQDGDCWVRGAEESFLASISPAWEGLSQQLQSSPDHGDSPLNDDGGGGVVVFKRLLRAGDGSTRPTTGSDVHVHFTCFVIIVNSTSSAVLLENDGNISTTISSSGSECGDGAAATEPDPLSLFSKVEVDSSRGTTAHTSPSGITMLKKSAPFRIRSLPGLGHQRQKHTDTQGAAAMAATVIPGWLLALPSMSLGERATFRFPPAMAYGQKGKGNAIPPGACLEYDLELVGVDGKYHSAR